MKKYLLFAFMSWCVCGRSQEDDLLKILNENTTKKKEYVTATFKTTRLVNFHTIETVGRHSLDFRISHRFGDINSGSYNAWGVDGGASIRLALEYSFDGRLMFGIGRTNYEKMVDGFLKFRLIRQTVDNRTPFSVTLFAGAYHTFLHDPYAGQGVASYYERISDRMSYVSQVMIARKFSNYFSLQIAPTYVHYNLVNKATDKNDLWLIAGVLRLKYTKRQAITIEYAYRLTKFSEEKLYDSFGIGWEVETGGHVFQVHLTNSFGLTENQFYAYTRSTWENFGVRLGFNISRVFTL